MFGSAFDGNKHTTFVTPRKATPFVTPGKQTYPDYHETGKSLNLYAAAAPNIPYCPSECVQSPAFVGASHSPKYDFNNETYEKDLSLKMALCESHCPSGEDSLPYPPKKSSVIKKLNVLELSPDDRAMMDLWITARREINIRLNKLQLNSSVHDTAVLYSLWNLIDNCYKDIGSKGDEELNAELLNLGKDNITQMRKLSDLAYAENATLIKLFEEKKQELNRKFADIYRKIEEETKHHDSFEKDLELIGADVETEFTTFIAEVDDFIEVADFIEGVNPAEYTRTSNPPPPLVNEVDESPSKYTKINTVVRQAGLPAELPAELPAGLPAGLPVDEPNVAGKTPSKKPKHEPLGGGSKFIKGGICSDPGFSPSPNTVDYIMRNSLYLADSMTEKEIRHDFAGSRENIGDITGVCSEYASLRVNNPIVHSAPINPELNDLLRSLSGNTSSGEWSATSQIFSHMLDKCPEELANCMMFKYEKVYKSGPLFYYDAASKFPVEDERIPFIVGFQGGELEDSEEASGSSVAPTTYYIIIGSNFLKLEKYYGVDILIGSVDAPSNNSLKIPLYLDPIIYENDTPIYSAQQNTGINPHNVVTIASNLDPSVSPPTFPHNFNTDAIFERHTLFEECDIGLSDRTQNPIYFAFAQMLLHPNASFARYFTNLAIDLFNKTFFELFGSTSRIVRPTDDGAVELFQGIDDFVDSVDFGENKGQQSFHAFMNGLGKTTYDQTKHGLLFTSSEDSLVNITIDDFSQQEVPTAISGQYKFCNLLVGNKSGKPTSIFIGFDDFSVSNVANTVNEIRVGNVSTIPGSPKSRLLALANVIYDGIDQVRLPAELRGPGNKNKMLSLIITSFKARGDGNQVALLALITAAVDTLIASINTLIASINNDPSVIDRRPVLKALKILVSKIFTNDKNTVVQSLILEKHVVKAGGGCQMDNITMADYRVADDDKKLLICFYYSRLTEKYLELGRVPAPEEIDDSYFSYPETLKVLFVSTPKGNPETMMKKSIIHMMESFVSQYTPSERSLASSTTQSIDVMIQTLKDDLQPAAGASSSSKAPVVSFERDVKNLVERLKNASQGFYFKQKFVDSLRKEPQLEGLYKKLFKAKSVYDVLSGHTVGMLDELGDILRDDIAILKKLVPPQKIGNLSRANFERIQRHILEHIEGKKIEVVLEAIRHSEDIFHLPKTCISTITSMIDIQTEVQTNLLELEKRLEAAIEAREKSKRVLPSRSSKPLSFTEVDLAAADKLDDLQQKIYEIEEEKKRLDEENKSLNDQLSEIEKAKANRAKLLSEIKEFNTKQKGKQVAKDAAAAATKLQTLKAQAVKAKQDALQEKETEKQLKVELRANQRELKKIGEDQAKTVAKIKIKELGTKASASQSSTGDFGIGVFKRVVDAVRTSTLFSSIHSLLPRISATFGGSQRTALNNRHRIYTKKRITRKKRRQPNRKTKTKSSNQRRITSKMASARRYHKRGYTHKK